MMWSSIHENLKLYQQTCLLCIYALLICSMSVQSEKIQYFSEKECGRYSLDAVYNEKFKVITKNIFKDTTEFVNRVSDLMAESLASIIGDLPNRRDSVSDNRQKDVFTQFESAKKKFSGRIKKMHTNITTSWESLIDSNLNLMLDNGKSSIGEYLNKTQNMAEAYKESRNSLDTSMESFVSFVKGTIRDGLEGITLSAFQALKKKEKKKNPTNESDSEEASEQENENESDEDKLMKKKIEITEMILKGFIKNITVEVIKQKLDLFKKSSIPAKDRDSVLDDIQFDIILINNRMAAIVHSDIPLHDKGSVDLARRNIYMHWIGLAEEMYEEKIRSKQSTIPGGDTYYQKLWSDEKQLVDTLLSLMEIYY